MINTTNFNIDSYLEIAKNLLAAGIAQGNIKDLALRMAYGHKLGLDPLESVANISFSKGRIVVHQKVLLAVAYQKVISNVSIKVQAEPMVIDITIMRKNGSQQQMSLYGSQIPELQLHLTAKEVETILLTKAFSILFPDISSGVITPLDLQAERVWPKVLKATKRVCTLAFQGTKTAFTHLSQWFSTLDTKQA